MGTDTFLERVCCCGRCRCRGDGDGGGRGCCWVAGLIVRCLLWLLVLISMRIIVDRFFFLFLLLFRLLLLLLTVFAVTLAGVIEGMSDGDRFVQTRKALDVIGMSEKEVTELLSAVSGVLHLGQASFFFFYHAVRRCRGTVLGIKMNEKNDPYVFRTAFYYVFYLLDNKRVLICPLCSAVIHTQESPPPKRLSVGRSSPFM